MSANKTKAKSKQLSINVDQVASEIVLKPLDQVIHESMMPYSEFVIMDRALPRVEDGLKPVQRRVLYSMLEVGVLPDKPFRKSARIVGDCMGKYHPHGDKSIYDTMVRMAQPFNMREILVEGHGNFGSVDGDGAAAMRYTEARLSPISLELLRDIEKDTVTWSFNFDDTTKEPDMLPGRFPNLLVNGASGIAVGLATNIPTHNLGEVIDATVAYINDRKITVDELMKIMPAPDFSTGGYILSSSELKQLYETGKGKVIIRAKINIENAEGGKKNLIITEIPYQVNKATMLQKIAKLKESDPENPAYASIYEIVDESDRNGTRAVIKLKKDANIPLLLQHLYKYSDLQINFNANMVAIAGGKPKLMGLLDILSYYVEYQKQVIYRRTKYDLDVNEKREHILSGLLIAIKEIDEVIKIIKASKSTNEAKTSLMEKFYLSAIQAQAILDMRLARLTNLEVNKLVEELEEVRALIEKLKKILESDRMQYTIIKNEMLEIKKKYATERLSQIINDTEAVSESADEVDASIIDTSVIEAPGELVHVIYSAGGTIKSVAQKNYNQSTRELSANPTLFEVPHISMQIMNNKIIYLFTNLGNCHALRVRTIPNVKYKDKGEPLKNLIKNFMPDEKVVAMFDLDENNANDEFVFVTKLGFVKISSVSQYNASKQSISAIKLKDEDEVVFVAINNKEDTLSLFTHTGMALNFSKADISVSGRVSMGVKGIGLSDGDYVVSAHQVKPNSAFVIFTSNGNAKVIKSSEVVTLVRARKGLKVINSLDKTVTLVYASLLDKNVCYVAKSSNQELTFVLNKKLSLENRLGVGKNVLNTKSKTNKLLEVYNYITENE